MIGWMRSLGASDSDGVTGACRSLTAAPRFLFGPCVSASIDDAMLCMYAPLWHFSDLEKRINRFCMSQDDVLMCCIRLLAFPFFFCLRTYGTRLHANGHRPCYKNIHTHTPQIPSLPAQRLCARGSMLRPRAPWPDSRALSGSAVDAGCCCCPAAAAAACCCFTPLAFAPAGASPPPAFVPKAPSNSSASCY